MEAKLSKYRPFRNFIGRAHLFSGLWPHLEEIGRFYRVITFTAEFLLAVITMKMFGYCLDNIDRLPVFVNGMPYVLTTLTLFIKVGCFVKYRQELVLLDNLLGKRYEEELKVKEHHLPLVGHISQYTRLTYGSSGITAFTLCMLCLPPIIIALKYKKYLYIYQGKYPFPVEGGGKLYWSILTLEAIAGYFVAILVVCIDNGFGLHSFRICGLFRLLGHKYSKLRSVSELAECVRTHQMLVRCCHALQRLYGPIILLTYLTSSVIMCTVMYQGNQLKGNLTVSRTFFLIFYMFTKLMQAFTCAYYGALISKESEKCLNAVYTSNWAISGDLQLMKNILMIKTQKPIVLNVKKFFVITMDMFAKIINTTISYFFLLQTVTDKD